MVFCSCASWGGKRVLISSDDGVKRLFMANLFSFLFRASKQVMMQPEYRAFLAFGLKFSCK